MPPTAVEADVWQIAIGGDLTSGLTTVAMVGVTTTFMLHQRWWLRFDRS